MSRFAGSTLRFVAKLAACLGIVFAAAPAAEASGARAHAAEDNRLVVGVLGDSVPAGFGLRQTLPDSLGCTARLPTAACDNEDLAYPSLVAEGLPVDESGGVSARLVSSRTRPGA